MKIEDHQLVSSCAGICSPGVMVQDQDSRIHKHLLLEFLRRGLTLQLGCSETHSVFLLDLELKKGKRFYLKIACCHYMLTH